MSLKLTVQSFVAGIKQSGLLDASDVDAQLAVLQRDGVDISDSRNIAQALVQRGVLTNWQADKLLQGRHKGFLLGRYKLLNLLGAGEMSAVYLAEHTMLERRCAIKVLPGNKVKDTSYLGRFRREAVAVAALDHANIVRAFDVDSQMESGTEIHFLVMEFVDGCSLEKQVTDNGVMDFIEAADFFRQAADGLQHAHQAGLVHRDIKPANLLIDKVGTVKLLDLGLARFFKSTDEESLTIKHDEKVLGTADYLAPEQAIDSHKVDHRADIYSLGCTLYFALTGHPPFTDGTLVQRLLAHQTRTPKSVRQERPDLPPQLAEILEKMMAKQASLRYQTAADVSAALTQWLVEHGTDAWRESHVSLVATVCGLKAMTRETPVVAAPAAAEKPAATAAESKPTTTTPANSATAQRKVANGAGAKSASGVSSKSANRSGKPGSTIRKSATAATRRTAPPQSATPVPRQAASEIKPVVKQRPAAAPVAAPSRPVHVATSELMASIPAWQVGAVAAMVVSILIMVLGIGYWMSDNSATASNPTSSSGSPVVGNDSASPSVAMIGSM